MNAAPLFPVAAHPGDLVQPGESSETLTAALEAARVAIALGGTVPAVPGMTVWCASLTLDREYTSDLGLFASKAAAIRALRVWVENEWRNGFCVPWADLVDDETDDEQMEAAAISWLNSKTDEEVIAAYFDSTDEDWYIVTETIVSN